MAIMPQAFGQRFRSQTIIGLAINTSENPKLPKVQRTLIQKSDTTKLEEGDYLSLKARQIIGLTNNLQDFEKTVEENCF